MRKKMHKVKSKWVVIGGSLLAVGGLALGVNASEGISTVGVQDSSHIQEQYSEKDTGQVWTANTVQQIESEIQEQDTQDFENYLIQWGDTLWVLSQASGISIPRLATINNIENPDLIYTGDYLKGILSNDLTDILPAGEDKNKPETEWVIIEDTVQPSLPEASRPVVTTPVTNTKVENVTMLETVPYPTEEREDATLLEGETRTIQNGADGSMTKRYRVTYVNGVETKREYLGSEVTIPAVPKIIVVGTKKASVVTTKTEELSETISYTSETREDAELLEGETRIVQVGVNGSRTNKFRVTFTDGVETARELISTEVTAEAVTEIIAVGTKKAPVVTTKMEEVTELVPYESETREDVELLEGETRVIQAGVTGSKTHTYQVTLVDGVETGRELVNTLVTVEATTEIIAVGTKKAPVETTATAEVTESIPYLTETREDAELLEGETRVIQAGVNGSKTHTYLLTLVDGVETNRELAGTVMTKEAVTEVIAVGTKKAPVVTTKMEEITEAIPYTTETREDADLEAGETRIIQAGINGSKTHQYQVTYVDGVETNRELVNTSVTVEATNQIIAVGTKEVEVKAETVRENETPYQTVEQEDNTLPAGQREVIRAGVAGYDTVTYDVTYVNGIEASRKETARVTTAAVNELIRVGTQVTEVKQLTAKENEVAYTSREIEDNTLATGLREVVQAGVAGYDTVTYDVTYVNGVESSRKETGRTTTAAVEEIVRVGTQVTEVKAETTRENEVAYTVVEQQDAQLFVGQRVTVQAGVAGFDTVTYDVTYVNGVETARKEVSRQTTAAVDEIVKVGTKPVVAAVGSTFYLENVSLSKDRVNEESTDDVRLTVKVTSGEPLSALYVTYQSDSGRQRMRIMNSGSERIKLNDMGNGIYEATLFSGNQGRKAGNYRIIEIEAQDSKGSWIVYSENQNQGSSDTHTSANLDGGTFVVEETPSLAKNNDVALKSITMDDSPVYIGEWQPKTLKTKFTSWDFPITNVRVIYMNSQGEEDSFQMWNTGNGMYEAMIAPTYALSGNVGTYSIKGFEVLTENGMIFLTADDLSTGTGSDFGAGTFEVKDKITSGSTTEEQEIPFETIYEDDSTLFVGQTKVSQEGVLGSLRNTYHVTYKNGIETGRTLVDSVTVRESIHKIVKRGTKTAIAAVNGIYLESLSVSHPVVYTGEIEPLTVTVKLHAPSEIIRSVSITYQDGRNVSFPDALSMQDEGNGIYTFTFPEDHEGRHYLGTHIVDNILVYTGNPLGALFLPVGKENMLWPYGNGDLSAGSFEVKDKITTGTVIEEKAILFQTVYENDPSMFVGQEKVTQNGANGTQTDTYTVTYKNGVETDRQLDSSSLTMEPVNKVVKRGTRIPFAAVGNQVYLENIYLDNKAVMEGSGQEVQLTLLAQAESGIDNIQVTYVSKEESWRVYEVQLTNRGNHTFTGTLPASMTDEPGAYKLSKIKIAGTVRDWFVYSEDLQEGIGWEHTSANFDAVQVDVTPVSSIARVGGLILKSLSVDETPAYTQEWKEKILTVKIAAKNDKITDAFVRYTSPAGVVKNITLAPIGNELYQAVITPDMWFNGAGVYSIDKISVKTENTGYYTLFLPNGFNNESQAVGDLSGGSFEVVDKVITETKDVFETIPFETIYEDDDTLFIGQTKVEQAGVAGSFRNTYEITYKNGVETGRTIVGSVMVTAPSTKIVKQGTKPALAYANGVYLGSISINQPIVHPQETSPIVLTVQVASLDRYISNVSIAYLRPQGGTLLHSEMHHEGNAIYTLTIPEQYRRNLSLGTYKLQYIVAASDYFPAAIFYWPGESDPFFPTGNGDLSGGSFEVKDKITTDTVTKETAIPFQTVYENDPSMFVGQEKVTQEGVNGIQTDTYTVTYTNGVETSQVLNSSNITLEPTIQIVKRGTKSALATIGNKFYVENLFLNTTTVQEGSGEEVLLTLIAQAEGGLDEVWVTYESSDVYAAPVAVLLSYAGNNTYTATLPAGFTNKAGTYTIARINGNGPSESWYVYPGEGQDGSGSNYTSANLNGGSFTVEKAIVATHEGVTIESIHIDRNVVYIGDGLNNKLTVKIPSTESAIVWAGAVYADSQNMEQWFVLQNTGGGKYETFISQNTISSGQSSNLYRLQGIEMELADGRYVMFLSENYQDNDYFPGMSFPHEVKVADLSAGDFEVIPSP